MSLVYILVAIVLTPGDQSSILLQRFLGTEFAVFTKMDTLTISIDSEKPMANPGESFNATDVIEDDSWPSQRLAFYGRSDSLWFIYYEQGGIGHSWYLILFRPVQDTVITLAAYWVISDPLKNLQELKALIRNTRLVSLKSGWHRGDNENILLVLSPSWFQVYLNRRR